MVSLEKLVPSFLVVVMLIFYLTSFSCGYQVTFETTGHNVYEEITLDVPISFYGSFYKKLFVSVLHTCFFYKKLEVERNGKEIQFFIIFANHEKRDILDQDRPRKSMCDKNAKRTGL